jgi:Bacteriocin-protection, YdeI or OmpD-Associated/Domain of unknown function (DUF1905)
MSITFTATVQQYEGVEENVTGIRVPAEVMSALGTQKRLKVKVSLNGYAFRSTVARYRGVLMLPLSAEKREAAGVKAGDQVEVTLEPDTEPRTVEVPDDLAAALAEKPGVRAAFDALSYTMRKEYVRQVGSAKAQETRNRRIAGIVAKLGNS